MGTGTRCIVLTVLLALSLIGLAASCLVHFASFGDWEWTRPYKQFFILHFLMFVPFASVIFLFRRGTGNSARIDDVYPYGLPRPLKIAHIVLFVYAMVNFALFLIWSEGDPRPVPSSSTGYALISKAKTTDISQEAYNHHSNIQLRGVSGHWIFFFYVPAACLGTSLARRDRGRTRKRVG